VQSDIYEKTLPEKRLSVPVIWRLFFSALFA